jgi:hypothetical protein
MANRSWRCRLVSVGLTALFASFLAVTPAKAQQQLGNKNDVQDKFRLRETRFNNLIKNTANYDAKDDKGLAELAAQYYLYRLTWITIQVEKGQDAGLADLRKRFNALMIAPETLNGKNQAFMKILAHEMIGCFKQILDLPFDANYPAVTSAALMLHDFGKCRQVEAHDFLMGLTKANNANKFTYSPFIRMCAVRGLGEFNNPNWSPMDDKQVLAEVDAKLKRDMERLEQIGNFIVAPYPPEPNFTEEQWDAWIYVRREGVKALAQCQVPAFGISKKDVQGPVAAYLLFYALGCTIEGMPAFTLPEKLEAVLGVMNLKLSETPQYNAELGVFAAARCLADFGAEYYKDFQYFGKVKGKDTKYTTPRLSEISWITYAAKLEDGLAAMTNNLPKDSAAAKKLEGVKSRAHLMLTNIKDRKQIDDAASQQLRAYADSIRPASFQVYQGFMEPALPPPPK